MRRANVQLKSDRRETILDAAQRCFARSGFHQTTVQQVCVEAGMSPGNLYRYFPSKEAIIAGIAERNRAQAAADFASVDSSPDFFSGFAALGRQYLVERDDEQVALCLEIMAESRHNPEVGRIYQTITADVHKGLVTVLRRAAMRGELAGDLAFEKVVDVILAIGDGIELRRAVDPSFDPETVLPLTLDLVRYMLDDSKEAKRGAEEKSHEG